MPGPPCAQIDPGDVPVIFPEVLPLSMKSPRPSTFVTSFHLIPGRRLRPNPLAFDSSVASWLVHWERPPHLCFDLLLTKHIVLGAPLLPVSMECTIQNTPELRLFLGLRLRVVDHASSPQSDEIHDFRLGHTNRCPMGAVCGIVRVIEFLGRVDDDLVSELRILPRNRGIGAGLCAEAQNLYVPASLNPCVDSPEHLHGNDST